MLDPIFARLTESNSWYHDRHQAAAAQAVMASTGVAKKGRGRFFVILEVDPQWAQIPCGNLPHSY